VEPEQLLGLALVHRQRRGEDVGPGVGDAEHLEQALDAAVLTPPAVQRDERDLDLLLPECDVDISIDIDRYGVVAALPERGEDRRSRAQGHVTLAGQTAEQHTDLAGQHLSSPWRQGRWL
jgi:hypothetical protein